MKYLFLLLTFSLSAQESIIVVKDELGSPISYATIIVNGYYDILTDSSGRFKFIDYGENLKTLEIHKVGYKSLVIPHFSIHKNPVVILEKIIFNPVGSSPKNIPKTSIGYKEGDKLIKDIYIKANLNYETGIVFEYIDEYKNKILSNVQLYTYFLGEPRFPLRLNVYSLDSKGLPKENILKNEITFTATSKKQWLEIDLENQNIPFPIEGIAITVELLNPQLKRFRIDKEYRPVVAGFNTEEYKWVFRYGLVKGWFFGTGNKAYAIKLTII